MWQRLVLLVVVTACIFDLERTHRVSRADSSTLTVLIVADGTSHEIEGLVRYLYWEFTVGNRLRTEIVLEIEERGGECARVAKFLLADGYLVEKASREPALVFRVPAERTATG